MSVDSVPLGNCQMQNFIEKRGGGGCFKGCMVNILFFVHKSHEKTKPINALFHLSVL